MDVEGRDWGEDEELLGAVVDREEDVIEEE